MAEMVRRTFLKLLFGVSATPAVAWTHGAPTPAGSNVIDDNGTLVVDDNGAQVVTS